MVIEEEYRKMIHTGSIAAISQLGIVGDKQVEILTTDFSMPVVRNGDVIQAAPPANYLAILEKADRAVQNVNNITASLDTLFLRFRRGEGTLGKLLTDDEAYNELVGVGESAQALFDETTRQFTDLSSVLRSTADNVDGITHESQKLIRDLGQGKGTVGALLGSVPAGTRPLDVRVLQNGARVYSVSEDQITAISTTTGTPVATIPINELQGLLIEHARQKDEGQR